MITMDPGLRVGDLVAKTARVTLKDTLRVMTAVEAIARVYETTPEALLETCCYSTDRPAPENVAACEQASFRLRSASKVDRMLAARMARLRALT